jgi:hypothetical protein
MAGADFRHECPRHGLEKCFCYGHPNPYEERRLTLEGEGWHVCVVDGFNFKGRRLFKWECIARVRPEALAA